MHYKISACLLLLMRWQDKSASVPAVAMGYQNMDSLWKKKECEHMKVSKPEDRVGEQAWRKSTLPSLSGGRGGWEAPGHVN